MSIGINMQGTKRCWDVIADLKLIYRAARREDAEQQMDAFSAKWDSQSCSISSGGDTAVSQSSVDMVEFRAEDISCGNCLSRSPVLGC